MRLALRLTIISFATAAVVAVGLVVIQNRADPLRCREVVATDVPNFVRQLRSVQDQYEIELVTEHPFVVRAMPTVLRIGRLDMKSSRMGFDGHSIAFTISGREFEGLQTGDPIFVHHTFIPPQLEENPTLAAEVITTDGWEIWTFGPFDKSQLDCPPVSKTGSDSGRSEAQATGSRGRTVAAVAATDFSIRARRRRAAAPTRRSRTPSLDGPGRVHPQASRNSRPIAFAAERSVT